MALGNKNKKVDRLATAHQWVSEGGPSGDFTVLNLPKGVNIWAPKEEKVYNVTIVPYEVTDSINKFQRRMATPGQLYYERSFQSHAGIGPEGSKKSYVCVAGTFGKKCAICQFRNKLSTPDNDPDTLKLIKDMRPKDRQLWNVFVHEEKQKGVQLWEVSWHLFGTFLQEKLRKADPEKREKYMRFHNPERGYDFRLSPREKTMGANKFLEFYDIEFKLRKEPLSEKLIEAATNLDDAIKVTPYDKLKEILAGGADEEEPEDDAEEDADEDDDAPPPKKKAGKKKPKPDPDEEDEDEPEEESDGDDEEDESEDEDEDDAGEDDGGEADEDELDDDDDEGDDDADEGEDAPLTKGEKVSWPSKKTGKRLLGKITSINHKTGVAAVMPNGKDKAVAVDVEDLVRAGELKRKAPPVLDEDDDLDDDEDLPPPKKKVKKPGRKDPF